MVYQPPSGGCVLKQSLRSGSWRAAFQPPSGGCVLKHQSPAAARFRGCQPPSGGCVLKPLDFLRFVFALEPAAFGRLCVETTKVWFSTSCD